MQTVQPIQLGDLELSSNLIQGPLAGYSNAPFRVLTERYGKPGFCSSEMLSAKTLLNQPLLAQKRFTYKDPREGKLCFQLAATEPNELAEAVKIVTDCGADLIDLNCGCPVKKIRSKGAGSKLLADSSHLQKLMSAMTENTHLPVSIKIRIDGDSDENYNQSIIDAVVDSEIDFLVVHGRHWTERYDVPCRFDEIRQFSEALKIPVIGNGDVACVETLQKMFAAGCDGIMVARAGVGQPWLFQKLTAELHGHTFQAPPETEIGEIFLEHVQGLINLLENEKFAILSARKLGKYYARTIADKKGFIDALNQCLILSELEIIVAKFFV